MFAKMFKEAAKGKIKNKCFLFVYIFFNIFDFSRFILKKAKQYFK
jgi:hypothetical protein